MTESARPEHLAPAAILDSAAASADATIEERFRPGPAFWAAVGWLALVVLVAALADVLPLHDPLRPHPSRSAQPPGWQHWFGTDTLGRDLLARVVHGARITLLVAFVSVFLAVLIGSLLGFAAGYLRGRIEGAVMGTLDILLAFPALVLALALTAFLGASVRNVVIAVVFVAIPVFGRLVRAQTLSFAKQEFVLASRATGATEARTLFTEVVPNVAPSIVSFGLVFAAIAIVIEGGLSFLGLGVPPPTPAWGSIIASGQPRLDRAPHISLIPSVVMFLTVLALNTVGDRLRAHDDLTDRRTT